MDDVRKIEVCAFRIALDRAALRGAVPGCSRAGFVLRLVPGGCNLRMDCERRNVGTSVLIEVRSFGPCGPARPSTESRRPLLCVGPSFALT